jgi:hypothetical protein
MTSPLPWKDLPASNRTADFFTLSSNFKQALSIVTKRKKPERLCAKRTEQGDYLNE